MPLFCTNEGIINTDLVFQRNEDFRDNLVELNYGVGAVSYEGNSFEFSDSTSGLIWDSITPEFVSGKMAYPINIGDYIYYLSAYNGAAASAKLNRIPYSLGYIGEQEVISTSDYGEYNSFLYVDGYFYLYSTEGHVTITSDFLTFTEQNSTVSATTYFNSKFHNIGTYHYSSVDGYTWINEGALPFEVIWEAHSDNTIIAGNNLQIITYDGVSWSSPIDLPVHLDGYGYPIRWADIAYNNGVFCIVGDTIFSEGMIGTSIDNGVSWQTQIITDIYMLREVVPMYPAKFWQLFVKTTES